jgi:hypothetical protein
MNDEENRREDFDALRATGVTVHSMSPRSMEDVGPAVAALAEAVAAPAPSPFGVDEWPAWLEDHCHGGGRQSCVTLVWRRPWMTLASDTYGASLLSFLGLDQIVLGGDDRYPEVTLDEIKAAGPHVVLLPSEPYVFREKHAAEISAEVPTADVRLIDGRDLFWWGARTPGAIARLVKALA